MESGVSGLLIQDVCGPRVWIGAAGASLFYIAIWAKNRARIWKIVEVGAAESVNRKGHKGPEEEGKPLERQRGRDSLIPDVTFVDFDAVFSTELAEFILIVDAAVMVVSSDVKPRWGFWSFFCLRPQGARHAPQPWAVL
jgi:hypothetical protein